jgi:hypothetical protein
VGAAGGGGNSQAVSAVARFRFSGTGFVPWVSAPSVAVTVLPSWSYRFRDDVWQHSPGVMAPRLNWRPFSRL